MQEGGGPLWILAEEKEMQTGISLLFLSPYFFFFSRGACSWGWIFEVCCHQAIHNNRSQAMPAPTSQCLPHPCISPRAGHLTSHLQGGAIPPALKHKCLAALTQHCYHRGGMAGLWQGGHGSIPSPGPAGAATLLTPSAGQAGARTLPCSLPQALPHAWPRALLSAVSL